MSEISEQVAAAYERMAREAHYRPAAPSDGWGNIRFPVAELDLDAEASAYAAHWWEQEDADEGTFVIGYPDWELRPAMIYAIEAARMACAADRCTMERLLELALAECRSNA